MKADDLGLVAATVNVENAIAVTVFALDTLLGVIGMAVRRWGLLRGKLRILHYPREWHQRFPRTLL